MLALYSLCGIASFVLYSACPTSYTGPLQLKHLLACMGELVTDAEVDMMVRMCDTEGRGMLSFFDVWAVAKHPNPGAPKFNARRLGNKLRMQMKEGKSGVSASRVEGGVTAEPSRCVPAAGRAAA